MKVPQILDQDFGRHRCGLRSRGGGRCCGKVSIAGPDHTLKAEFPSYSHSREEVRHGGLANVGRVNGMVGNGVK